MKRGIGTMNRQELSEKIEKGRKHMIKMSNIYGLNSEETLEASRKLDELILQYLMMDIKQCVSN